MDTNQLDPKFTDSMIRGIKEATDRMSRFRDRIKEAADRLNLMKNSQSDGGFAALTSELLRATSATKSFDQEFTKAGRSVSSYFDKMSLGSRNFGQSTIYANKALADQGLMIDKLSKQSGGMQSLVKSSMAGSIDNARLKTELLSGSYLKAARAAASVGNETAKLQKQAQFQQSIAQLGRFGAYAQLAADKLRTVEQRVAGIVRPAAVGFAVASASLLGFVRAGLEGTVEGYRLGLQFTYLSREIASLFLPAIKAATDQVSRLVQWFQQLDASGQKQARNMALLGLGTLGAVASLPKLAGGLSSVLSMSATLASSLGISAAILGPIAIAVAAVAAGVAVWAGLFAAAYTRSQGLRDSVAELYATIMQVYGMLKPLINMAIDNLAASFTKFIDINIQMIKLITVTFVESWNWAIVQVSSGLMKLAKIFSMLADKSNNPWLKEQFEGIRGALLEAAGLAQKLRIGPAGPDAGPGKPGQRVTMMQTGTESSIQSFQRLQEQLYRAAAGQEDPQKQAVGELQKANIQLQAIAGGIGNMAAGMQKQQPVAN